MGILNKYWKDIVAVLVFVVVAVVYFCPATFDGRRLNGHDHSAADGLSVEMSQYRNTHDGETPRWLNSLFGGMPTYQIAPSYDSTKGVTFIEKLYHLWLPDYVFYIFISMLGFYILLRAFDFKEWMSALGAIVWAFSSYFFIIIAAGHIWKVLTLAYIPPTIAGMVLCYRKKYLSGLVVTALFATLQIISNHVQMTYYFLIPEILMVIAFLVDSVMRKDVLSWVKASGCIAVGAAIAIGINLSNLYHTYEYSKDTMRGKSELVNTGSPEDQTDSGLERSYITNWSYGIGETWSLLVPNVRGGASVPLSMNETAMKKADPQFNNAGIYGAFAQYWGEQPGTSGPVYVGALVFMLFILSLIIVPNKNPLKWALLLATILSILLSWGKNFMGFTDFFIDNIPMYSKFRTVSSILVVAEFTIPLMALLGIRELLSEKSGWSAKGKQTILLISAGITLIICLAFALGGSSFECLSTNDRAAMDEYMAHGYFDSGTAARILASISAMRAAMLTADAWRSFAIIAIGSFIIWMMLKGRNKLIGVPSGLLLIVLCLVDMWSVNKRYLNDKMFEPAAAGTQKVQKTDAYQYILDQSGANRDYRVLNMTVSTFNDNTTSAFFSSVGGYHAAKLRRYQELIERHISPEMNEAYRYIAQPDSTMDGDRMFPVINMLNTRWFVLPGQNATQIPVENPLAYGNAWFVRDIKVAHDADEEIAALGEVVPRHTAVVGKDFSKMLEGADMSEDSTAYVRQTSLISDEVRYEVDSEKGGVVVFSEIYYPGWKATIDGRETDIARVDYVLRALKVPAGKHEIVMEFRPQSIATTETVAYVCFTLLLLSIISLIAKKIISEYGKKS